jgi:uncharacterized protein YndB with AHSA1/START domain
MANANATETTTVERELLIAASPETVWELLVDPDKASAWMGMQSWSEPEPGGLYRVEIIPGHVARGEYVELDPPRRLVFTWGWEGDANPVGPGTTTIEFELSAEGEHTRLHFVHSGLPGAESGASHAHGWDHYFERLATAAAGGDVGPDPWLTGPMS